MRRFSAVLPGWHSRNDSPLFALVLALRLLLLRLGVLLPDRLIPLVGSRQIIRKRSSVVPSARMPGHASIR